MSAPDPDLRLLTESSFAALQAGNLVAAKAGFERLTATGRADTMHWLGLAMACLRLGDQGGSMSALDRSLQLEPRNVRAVLMKADLLMGQQRQLEALQHYRHALHLTSNARDLPQDIARGIERARDACSREESRQSAVLLEKLRVAGIDPAKAPSRFKTALDLMLGHKEIYHQQPRMFYYPGLPQVQFYERDAFEWVGRIEEQTQRIKAELLPLVQQPTRFSPYVKSGNAVIGRDDQGLADNSAWSALYLWEHSRLVPENAPLFPDTLAALDLAPMPHIPRQAPMALFSKLAPRTRIPPHTGLLNTRLICHLPLVVPPDCGALRVGNEAHPWVEGEMLIFDDSIEHEAWNDSDQERVVLLFEVWRPEISAEERAMLTVLLRVVKEQASQGQAPKD